MTKSSLVSGNKLTAPYSWLSRVTRATHRFGMINCLMAQKGNRSQEHDNDSDLLGRDEVRTPFLLVFHMSAYGATYHRQTSHIRGS